MNKLNTVIQSGKSLLIFLILLCVVAVITMSAWSHFNQENNSLAISQAESSTSQEYLGKDWTLTNLKGQPIRLSDFQGQPVLLVFWATWCPYCKKLLPGIAKLNTKYEAKGLKVIAVNIKEDWKPHVYWRNHEYQFDAVLEGDEVAKTYGVSGTPGLVFIDPMGKVLAVKSFSDPQHPLLEKFAQFYTSEIVEK